MELLLVLLSASAAGFGIFVGVVLVGWHESKRRTNGFRSAMGYQDLTSVSHLTVGSSKFHTKLIENMILASRSQNIGLLQKICKPLWNFGLGKVDELIEKAGLSGVVTKDGIVSVRLKMSCSLMIFGLLFGLLFSEILSLMLALAGFLFGLNAPVRALKEEKRERAFQIEKQLSQMIEVLVLGLRSGMSFDRSLELYRQYFDGGLSKSMGLAQQQWTHGLMSRDKALRYLAQSCESLLFGRAVESIIRSLRFGTSLAEGLSMLAVEARSVRRSTLEERIAKAPVKMLLPVGGLILPAMLILILGPVLLDLMAGF